MAAIGGADTIVSRGLEMHIDILDVNSYAGSGTTITEVVSKAEGALTNSTISTSPTTYMNFDGSGYLSLTGHRSTTLNSNKNTLEMWFQNNTGTGYEGIFSSGVPYQVYARNNHVEVYISRTGTTSYFIQGANETDIGDDGAWTLLSLVRDKTKFYWYINGELDRTLTIDSGYVDYIPHPTSARLDTVLAGYSASQYRYTGGIGPVRQYNRALSTGEILHNFKAQRDRFGI